MDEHNEQSEAKTDEEDVKDLDVDQDEADKVMGGARRAGDPCDGGE
ncbi:MAG TPA: hypothetical protein VNI55_07920 [Gaiellaceae bacterium]|nr:hypothetical protein [Gaiellaceae bacterium]